MHNRISVVSLGCPKNLVDSDTLTRKLISNGFLYRNAPEESDILLINTCGFIEDAKKESIEEILKLAAIKKGSRGQGTKGSNEKALESSNPFSVALRRMNPRTLEPYPKLIVFGCLAKRYKDELTKEIPEIDEIFGVGEDDKIVEFCKSLEVQKRKSAKMQKSKNSRLSDFQTSTLPNLQASYAYLKIADGCSKRCSYCVIPSIRGNYKSISPDKIIKEAERLIKAGAKELILVAQDTACYGKDLKGYDISSLLKDLCKIRGDFWIRLLYAYPASISDSLINVIANEDKICKYLDIPFQHSGGRILKMMGRKGSRKEYLELIKNIRIKIPDVALRTTFIVGFPSETGKEFNSLIDFIEEVRFDRLGVFKYSKEEGTLAAKLKGHLTVAVKNKRLDKIMRHQAQISLEKNKELIGKRFKAIIDEISSGTAIARLYSHAPEIDGVVIIERAKAQKSRSAEANSQTSKLPRFLTSKLKVGDLITIEITDAFDYDLEGNIII